jgi:apolipoprotein D and lipocalin family protein
MKKISLMMLAVLGCLAPLAMGRGSETAMAELKVVDKVDVARYMGKWYSIASIPMFFDKDCAGGTTADYSLRDDGDVDVVNACYRKDGSLMDVKGRAWVVDPATNAKLKVSFFLSSLKLGFLGGDYWIVDLGSNYECAVVGHPDRASGWVLARAPQLDPEVLKGIFERLTAQGYDVSRFAMVNHQDYPPPAQP